MRSARRPLVCAFLVLALACARRPRARTGPFVGPADLRATTENSGIVLRWRPGTGAAGGAWIEFATPGADFVKLDVAWPQTTTFTHADLAADTTFIYRLVPFFGRPSALAVVTTGASSPDGDREEEGPFADAAGPPASAKSSLRSLDTFAAAAPTGLAVTLAAPTSAELRWEDRAADEDAYLVELSLDGDHFQVCALLPPDATSFRKIALPPATRVTFRVRAIFLGPPSSPAAATTPAERPPQGVTAPRAR